MKNFAGINFRESPILKNFAGINFHESTFLRVKKGIYFREFGQNLRNFLPVKISSLKVPYNKTQASHYHLFHNGRLNSVCHFSIFCVYRVDLLYSLWFFLRFFFKHFDPSHSISDIINNIDSDANLKWKKSENSLLRCVKMFTILIRGFSFVFPFVF